MEELKIKASIKEILIDWMKKQRNIILLVHQLLELIKKKKLVIVDICLVKNLLKTLEKQPNL